MKLLGSATRVNATQLQVAIAILAGIEWMLENPKRGVITAEEIPYKYILRRCIPYWGNFFNREITTMGTAASTGFDTSFATGVDTTLIDTNMKYNDNYSIPVDLIIDKF